MANAKNSPSPRKMDFAEQIAMIFSFIADADCPEFERKNG